MQALQLEVWSDIACPWCYVGKRRLDRALERVRKQRPVQVTWRAFELAPDAPPTAPPKGTYAERIATKYSVSIREGQSMVDRMTAAAAEEGLAFDFDAVQPGNTFDAHRLIALARERGRAEELCERLMSAYLIEGLSIGDPSVLTQLASQAGLDAQRTQDVLAGDEFSSEVRSDESAATTAGIHSVPSFVLNGASSLSGAQPPALLVAFLGGATSAGD